MDDISNGLKDAFVEVDNGLKSLVSNLDSVNSAINGKTKELLQTLLSSIQTLLDQEQVLQHEFMKYVTSISQQMDQWLLHQNPEIEALFQATLAQLSGITFNTPVAIGISTLLTYLIVSSVLTWSEAPPPSKPYPLQRYDPVAAQAYFDGRTTEFVGRALTIFAKSLRFGLAVLQDYIR